MCCGAGQSVTFFLFFFGLGMQMHEVSVNLQKKTLCETCKGSAAAGWRRVSVACKLPQLIGFHPPNASSGGPLLQGSS